MKKTLIIIGVLVGIIVLISLYFIGVRSRTEIYVPRYQETIAEEVPFYPCDDAKCA